MKTYSVFAASEELGICDKELVRFFSNSGFVHQIGENTLLTKEMQECLWTEYSLKNKVNINVISVLKLNKAKNELYLDFIEVIKHEDIDNELTQFVNKINVPKSIGEILVDIEKNKKLRILLGGFDYCKCLDKPYQRYKDLLLSYMLLGKFSDDFHNSYIIDEVSLTTFIAILKGRLLAYRLELTYKKCDAYLKNNSILTYSHRKCGWSAPKYQIDKDFSVEFKTNFGYGSKSYFYSRIKFRELEIIPFSEWINYENGNSYEIVLYSSKHYSRNESWVEALEYVRDAYNLYAESTERFIKKYLVDELEYLVWGLRQFLHTDKFEFMHGKRYNDNKIDSQDLIQFRGQKISGALTFIDNIIKCGELISIEKYVLDIEDCCIEIQPMLKNELFLIEKQLQPRVIELGEVEPLYDNLQSKMSDYDNLKMQCYAEIGKGIIDVFERGKIDEIFNERHPEYSDLKSSFKLLETKYKTLKSEILSLETLKKNIQNYQNSISDYFQNKV